MPTELLSSGVPTSVLQNTVYALPAGASFINSTLGLEVSNDGTSWAGLTKSASAKRFVRCTSGNGIILVRSLGIQGTETYEVIGAPALTYQDTIKADGAIAYWPLDETSGTTAFDKVGTRHGTISGGVTLNQAGVNGSKCMVFPEVGTSRIVPSSFPPTGSAFTIECWAHPINPAGGVSSITNRAVAGDGDYQWYRNVSGLFLYYYSGVPQTFQYTNQLLLNMWTHVVLTAGGGQLILYINGVAEAPRAITASGAGINNPALCGSTEAGAEAYGWRGKMQDIAIYNRALSPAEISSHYTKRLEGAPFSGLVSTDQLVSLWDFDADFNDKVGTNHLTNNGGVTRVPGKLGNAASFNGVNQYLSHADPSPLGDENWTYSLWFKRGDNNTSFGLLGKDGATGSYYAVPASSGTVTFYYYDGTWRSAGVTHLADMLWHFLTLWHDAAANTINVQIDNGTVATSPTGGVSQPVGANTPVRIGWWERAEQYFSGLIDQPLLFKRILSAAERTAMWNSGNGLRY